MGIGAEDIFAVRPTPSISSKLAMGPKRAGRGRHRCMDPNVDSRRGPHCALLDRAA
ncbi:hypothetical protein CRG98_034070 [Punica granatum]|uniref:Uncharacterized protein n=1 Tax=Punica granatum TaxID=22663 RepID=A0A2I0ING6_PUNGR|nr:hypothetical protein CRG98_034070 [Punica granatum]